MTAKYITPSRKPPYTADGFSIIATCHEQGEAEVLAAAPELLEACRALVADLDASVCVDPGEDEPAALMSARAAIAKAEREGG